MDANRPAVEPPLNDGTLNRTIVRLAIPAILENLLNTAVFFVDALLLGWLGDPVALAAVGLSSAFFHIAQGIFVALGVAALAIVARAWGAGNYAEARHAAGQALSLTLVAALGVTVLMALLTGPFLNLLVRDPNPLTRAAVIEQGSLYLGMLLITAPLALARLVGAMIMRAAGNMRTPMLITLLVNVINIALASLLIFGGGPVPAMGIRGAGIGTAIAQGIGGLLVFGALVSGRSQPSLTPKQLFVWNTPDVLRLLRLALPSIVESGIQQAGFITFAGMVSSLGAAAMAAHQIADRVEALSFMPAHGLATAVATIVGQALGARNTTMAKLAVRRTALFGAMIMLAVGALYVIFGTRMVAVFGARNDVQDLAGIAVRLAALELPTMTLYLVYSSALRGAGDTRSPMIVSLIGAVFFRVSVVYLLVNVFKLGLAGVWLGTAIDWTGRALVVMLLYRRGRWQTLKV